LGSKLYEIRYKSTRRYNALEFGLLLILSIFKTLTL
jgi:hypothetical protein